MGLQLFERAVRDKQKMDKLFGVPAAKTLSTIGGNRDGRAASEKPAHTVRSAASGAQVGSIR